MINDTLKQPIMAHPPSEESDISLEEFLKQIKSFNENVAKDEQKHVKIDFKTTEVFINSLEVLNKTWIDDSIFMLSADLYEGPVNSSLSTLVDPDYFFAEAKKFSAATLSPGWTTRWDSNLTEGSYTRDQVNAMIEGIKNKNITNPISFSVRAAIVANSLEEMKYLYDSLKDSNQITFTVWSSALDMVDIEGLRKMIFTFGIEKVC